MPRVVRMSLEDCKRAIELLEQHHAGELVRERHLAEREREVGNRARGGGEAIRRAHRKDELLRAAVLLVAHELRELFRSELPATLIEDDKYRPCASAEFLHGFQQ